MPNTELQWKSIAGKRFLKFVFSGHFSAKEAAPAIIEWRRQFDSDIPSGHKVSIIWDCLKMTGFDPHVKSTWQKTLKELSIKIEDIWIVSKNPMIRVAALTMGVFSNYKIKTAIDESDIR